MDEYPEELRTPPVALVALVGVPELHAVISSSLHMEQPPINTLALPDFSKVVVLAGKERKPVDARLPPPMGILKIDWLWKHRTKMPAVLAVLLSRDQVYGDPAQWLQVCTNLDNIKNVVRGRSTKLVVVVVQPTLLSGDLSEDRLIALRKRAEVDTKCFLTFISEDPSEQKRSLARLGSILGELTNAFYREEGRRVKLRLEKKTFSSTELGVRYNFKVAVYAEFRRDWVEALKFYESAYTLLQEMASNPIELQLVQRLVEVKAVAEQLHFKVSTLLLHSGKVTEAVKWFRQHMTFYKHLIGPPESVFIHWTWVSKQFLVFAELLQNSLTTSTPSAPATSAALPEPPVTDRELQPGYYYQVAAFYMIERRRSFESISTMVEAFEEGSAVDVLAGSPEEVGPPLYVGQASCLLGRGSSFDLQRPTEKEYLRHALAQDRSFRHSHAAINLQMKAYEQYKSIQASRMVYHVASEMGREYFTAREYANAKRLFDSVSGMYRQEAWVALLWASLGYLRECARQLQLLKEYAEYTLEMAALPTSTDSNNETGQQGSFGPEVGPAGPLCHSQREQLFQEALNLLQGKHIVLPAREGESGLTVTETHPVSLEIDVVSPLRAAFSVCVAFHEQSVKPGMAASLTLSLLTHLPQELEIEELEVHFNQSECNFILLGSRGGMLDAGVRTAEGKGLEIKTGFDLRLEPNKWKRTSIDVIAGQSGKLECLTVRAHMGNYSSILCQAESPASREEVSIWKFEPQLDLLPMRDGNLSFFGQKTIQVEEPEPLVEIILEASGPGLVGDMFPVDITVKSRGHAINGGEIKVGITDSMGLSIMSPPATSIALEDAVFVELYTARLTPSEMDGERDSIYEKFPGVLTLPAVQADSSWSTKFFVRWEKPKPVSLFVTVSYQSESMVREAVQPHQFLVHKVLQLECEEPFIVSHRFLSPFRKDALLLGGLRSKLAGQSPKAACIPMNETSTLMIIARNSSSSHIRLLSVTVVEKDSNLCSIRPTRSLYGRLDSSGLESCGALFTGPKEGPADLVTLMPGEVFTQLFAVYPTDACLALDIGSTCLKWQRWKSPGPSEMETETQSDKKCSLDLCKLQTTVSSYIPLPAVQVEKPPLVISLLCPPHALLGVPFSLNIRLQNQTSLIQEIKFSVVDSACFLLSGVHSDTVHLLPYSTDVLSYKLIPLASGLQQLPQVNLSAAHFNAGFQQSLSSSQIFIFPSSPHMKAQMLNDLHSSSLGVSQAN